MENHQAELLEPQIDEIEQTYSVSEINTAIAEAITASFPNEIWVKGEIQRLNFHSSGHIYFNLCDSAKGANSTIPVSLFKFSASQIKANLREVLAEDREVRLKVKPNFYAPYGKMSLVVSDVDAQFTLGMLAIEKRKLLEKLEKEGILRANAAFDIDELPVDIALITALDSAAYHDVVDQLEKSGFGFRIKVINALMQGNGSVDSVCRAISLAQKVNPDVILLCRGGGAKSDLSSFDSEKVARAICDSSHPVITGLGHQIDISVADMVAHSSFKTPTACAQFLIDRICSSIEEIELVLNDITKSANDHIRTQLTNLGYITQRLSDAQSVLEKYVVRIGMFSQQIKSSYKNILATNAAKIKSSRQVVNAHDPMRVLERGYSLTLDNAGKIVKKSHDVKPDQILTTKFSDGEIDSKVIEVKENNGNEK